MDTTIQIVDGFSKTNRWLVYTSVMLSPAQAISGWGSNIPTNVGFLAYNWYTQIVWYRAVQRRQLNALSLLPVHFNTLYCFSYLGGITCGNVYFAILLGLGTAGVMILNCISAWLSWKTSQTDGYGVYEFFFFGWRILSPGWHDFILVWNISDTLQTLTFSISAVSLAIIAAIRSKEKPIDWWWRYPTMLLGSLIMLFMLFPVILWVELIVNRNNIESGTDWVQVWLFIGQVVTLIIPTFCIENIFSRNRKIQSNDEYEM